MTEQMIHTEPEVNIEGLEREMLSFPQVECPVTNYIHDGIYIREVRIPAGTIAIGHRQRFTHLNSFIQGKVQMLNSDGTTSILHAPATFLGSPGRKMGLVLEDVVWQNVYSFARLDVYTDGEVDIEKLENTFIEKSDVFNAVRSDTQVQKLLFNDDYKHVLDEWGVTEEEVKREVENTEDMVDLEDEPVDPRLSIRNSSIHGKGVFATSPISRGEEVGAVKIGDKRTRLGRWTNHSPYPNVAPFAIGDKIVYIAIRPIKGCEGGGPGEEITVNYRENLKLVGRKKCLE